jgi:hypothetical protein
MQFAFVALSIFLTTACPQLDAKAHRHTAPAKVAKEKHYGFTDLSDSVSESILKSYEARLIEMRLDQISEGMTIDEVKQVLGRNPDRGLAPGGTMGDHWFWWYFDSATVFVSFSCVSTIEQVTYTAKARCFLPSGN